MASMPQHAHDRHQAEPWRRLEAYGFSTAIVAALRLFIQTAADHELYRINPRYLAERLDIDTRTALRLSVAAIAVGLLTLEWHVYCPQCQYKTRSATALDALATTEHCRHCGHDFLTHVDDEVSVTISISEAVRPLDPQRRDDPKFRATVDAELGRVPALALIDIPTFRDLIAGQLVPEGQLLGVRSLAICFSDLRGSTALYHRLGDAAAYRLVCQHFQALFGAVAEHQGSAVKTIGDGMMGVFADPAAALHGIVAAHSALSRLNETAGLDDENRLILKVGLHVGPAIVVTLNGRLDYFGETINIASRLSELAQGGDVVISQAILQDPTARAVATQQGELAPLSAQLRGLSDRFDLYRLRVPAPAARA